MTGFKINDQIEFGKGQTDWDRLKKEGDYEGEEEFAVDWNKAKMIKRK